MTKGFSLIELGLVIAIIALLTSSVLAGSKLLDNVRNDGIINNISAINKAVQDFNNTYNCYPGDCWNARDALGLPNGNGDNILTLNEKPLFWEHLLASGFLTGYQSGDSMIYDKKSYHIASISPVVVTVPEVPESTAMKLDAKYDNGQQDSGIITAECLDNTCVVSFLLQP